MSDIRIVPADRRGIKTAVKALAEGRLVLHPTETVVSLSGDPGSLIAVERARRIKGYEAPRPFLCLVADVEGARKLARRWSPDAERLTGRFWPGPLTIVVPVARGVLPAVAEEEGLALRAVADPISGRLVEAWGGAIFSTSANRRGEAPAVQIEEAVRRLADVPEAGAVALALAATPGDASEGSATNVPSTIVDLRGDGPRLVRAGAVSLDRLREVVPGLP